MLSTLTLISGRTRICDIDMLLIVGTSSLFSNVMQAVHELMTLLPLHWTNILLMVLVLKKAILVELHAIQGHIYQSMLIDSLPAF